jgi:hypothetical protein
MDRTKYDIEIKHHAFIQATKRQINPDLIYNTIKNGKIERFGKNYIKFISRSVACVGEIEGLKIKIITITWRRQK